MDRGYDTRSPIQKKSSLPRTFALFRAYILVTLFLFGISIFFTIAYAPLFEIRSVVVSGGEITPHENVQAYVSKVLEGNWQTLLPVGSTVSIPVRALEKNITKIFPSVKLVEIDRVGLSEIHISITDRVSVYSYCKDTNCVLIDQEGIISAIDLKKDFPLPTIEGNTAEFTRRSSVKTIESLALGEPLLQTSQRISLEKVRAFLVSQGFIIQRIQLNSLGFFDVFAVYENGGHKLEFRFRDNKRIETQIRELQLALEKGLHQKILENKVSYVISYIPQKVIYKNTDLQN